MYTLSPHSSTVLHEKFQNSKLGWGGGIGEFSDAKLSMRSSNSVGGVEVGGESFQVQI